MTNNSNPLGNPRIGPLRPQPVRPPTPDVVRKQDPNHTREDFLSDLKKATRRERQSSRGRGLSKT